MPNVYNRRKGKHVGAVYVGRPGPFGNPFTHLPQAAEDPAFLCENREESIRRYEEWLRLPEQAPLLARIKRQLRGRDLECWCSPEPCHADIILEIANSHE